MFESKKILETANLDEKNISILGSLPEHELVFEKDSRSFSFGAAYLSILGEHFDGFDFVEDVLKCDCPLVVYTGTPKNREKAVRLSENFPKTCFIGVNDVVLYAQKLCSIQSKIFLKMGNKIIGITGSNGKTTSKEMLFHLLNGIDSLKGKVRSTFKNFNNHIGVPLTVLSVKSTDKILIVEMGSNHPGEIPLLCNIANPSTGLITNIGDAHLEFFGTRENIFKEKSELFHSVKKSHGTFVIDMDDKHLKTLAEEKGVLSFSEEVNSKADAILEYKKASVDLEFQGKTYNLKNSNITGKHNFKNLSHTFLLSLSLFPKEEEKLTSNATSFIPSENRSSWLERKGKRYYLDAYNANPSSMIASIEAFLDALKQERIDLNEAFFILGDMNELGEKTQKLHEKIALLLQESGVKNAAFIGKYSSYYSLKFANKEYCFKTKEEFLPTWTVAQKQFSVFFIKGSRSLQLESLLSIK